MSGPHDDEPSEAEKARWASGQERTRKARASAQQALDDHAGLDVLRTVAAELGHQLIDAANDRQLWRRLARGQAKQLTAEQRTQLNAAIQIDWVPVLENLGHQPPPPADDYGPKFVVALQRALYDKPPDVDELRGRLRELGEELRRLTGAPRVSRWQLRRKLRRAIRVAGPVLIALGAAAAGAAVGTLVVPAGGVLGAVVAAVVQEAIVLLGEAALNRFVPEEVEDPVAAYRANAERARLLLGVSADHVEALAGQWADGVGNLEESRQLVSDAYQRLFVAWQAGFGWPWFTPELAAQFDVLLRQLGRVRDELDEPGAQEATTTMRELADSLADVQVELRNGLERYDPETVRVQELASQTARVHQLRTQLAGAVAATRQARLRALTQPGHEAEVQQLRAAEAELRGALAEAERRRDELAG